MNLYKYWVRLKVLYPQAVARCTAWFEYEYRKDWRTEFKNPERIIEWLGIEHIQIEVSQSNAPGLKDREKEANHENFRFRLKSPEESTTTNYIFSSIESAAYDALERAMRILEQRMICTEAQNV